MNYAKTLTIVAILATTSALLLFATDAAYSFAQNETTTYVNQSTSADNVTAMDNATGSGNIAASMVGH